MNIPARLKEGGLRSPSNLRAPAFKGAILDILPRCIETKDDSGELTKGVYATQLSGVIGERAFDKSGHRNGKFL